MNKSGLAIQLSKLKTFDRPKVHLEQYSTDSEIAADILWNAYMLKDIEGKFVADYGAGPGTLGIGALELGATKVFFIEMDDDAIKVLEENTKYYKNKKIFSYDISNTEQMSDTVIMNPPFGVKQRKADKRFVEKAFKLSKVTYYIGKISSKKFIEAMAKDYNKKITHFWEYTLPLKKTMYFHTKKKKDVQIGCWRLE